MGIWGNAAATKKFFSTHLGGAPAPGAPPLPTPLLLSQLGRPETNTSFNTPDIHRNGSNTVYSILQIILV